MKTKAIFGLMATAALTVAVTTAPAFAGTAVPQGFTRNSAVTDVVVDNGDGTWTYKYTVFNTSTFGPLGPHETEPIIVDWELPWFGDAGIDMGSILSPHNWTWSVETIGMPNSSTGWEGVASWQDPNDPFYAGAGSPFTNVTQVLHWYNACWARGQVATFAVANVEISCEGNLDNAIFMPGEGGGGSLDGFEFTAEFDRTAAPYQASWAFLPVRSGDPSFPLGGVPASPSAIGITAVPVPGVLLLLGGGLLAFGAARRFRRY